MNKAISFFKDASRRFLWRVGRRAYCIARGDVVNDPRSNGEYWLLETVLRARRQSAVLDIGANRGEWSHQALTVAKGLDCRVMIYAFEPCSPTRALLVSRLGNYE